MNFIWLKLTTILTLWEFVVGAPSFGNFDFNAKNEILRHKRSSNTASFLQGIIAKHSEISDDSDTWRNVFLNKESDEPCNYEDEYNGYNNVQYDTYDEYYNGLSPYEQQQHYDEEEHNCFPVTCCSPVNRDNPELDWHTRKQQHSLTTGNAKNIIIILGNDRTIPERQVNLNERPNQTETNKLMKSSANENMSDKTSLLDMSGTDVTNLARFGKEVETDTNKPNVNIINDNSAEQLFLTAVLKSKKENIDENVKENSIFTKVSQENSEVSAIKVLDTSAGKFSTAIQSNKQPGSTNAENVEPQASKTSETTQAPERASTEGLSNIQLDNFPQAENLESQTSKTNEMSEAPERTSTEGLLNIQLDKFSQTGKSESQPSKTSETTEAPERASTEDLSNIQLDNFPQTGNLESLDNKTNETTEPPKRASTEGLSNIQMDNLPQTENLESLDSKTNETSEAPNLASTAIQLNIQTDNSTETGILESQTSKLSETTQAPDRVSL